MLEGLYSAAAGMEAQQTQLDAISNNIANVDTPGYQSEIIGFHDLLYTTDNDDPSSAIVGAGAAAGTLGYNQTQGTVEQTGNPLDIALQGSGFLQVRQADGTIGLTRNGTLQTNAAGQLTTSLGMLVQPPITLPQGAKPSDVQIGPDGTVSVGNQKLGQLQIVTVTAPDQLLPRGNSVYSTTTASGPTRPATGTTVTQGALVQSNVDMDTEITNMETAQQGYDMASKAIQIEAQMGQIAASLK